MTRHPLVRLLLSRVLLSRVLLARLLLALLLLVSQQMATTHALSHWGGALGVASSGTHQDRAGDLSSAFAQDQTCTQCLAFAQLAGTLGSQARAFVAPEAGRGALIASNDAAACARTVCVFQSRAPPLA